MRCFTKRKQLGVVTGCLFALLLGCGPAERSELAVRRISNADARNVIARGRQHVVSSCLDGYPNLFVFVVPHELEENFEGIPTPCKERAAYIGISTCETPPRFAAYRLPDRCGWHVLPNHVSAIAETIRLGQPPEAVKGESAVARLRSMPRTEGLARHESLHLLVSVEKVEVLRRSEGEPFAYPPP